jgi:putative flippase GtrA
MPSVRSRRAPDDRRVTTPRWRAIARHPLARRITGYSAGSVVAATTGELAFVATFGWVHAGATWATAAGFVGGAVPNYILNRRWAWPDRRGRSRRTEIGLYVAVVVCSFAAAAVTTHWVEAGTRQMYRDRALQTVLVSAAYLAISGVFFVLKFVLYELVVFTPARKAGRADRPDAVEPRAAPSTTL